MNPSKSIAQLGISGSTLKTIAILAMFCDHIGSVVLERMYDTNCLHGIGRIAFPIFIFLLVEGLMHTKSRSKYLLRMTAFALISEIPFDLAFNINTAQFANGTVLELSSQNVFFTLSIGLFSIICIDWLIKQPWNSFLRGIPSIIIGMLSMLAAFYLRVDYARTGVLAIILMYLFRRYHWLGMLLVSLCVTNGVAANNWAYVSILPVMLYNGKRGFSCKWIFYLFYPAHLLLLWLLCCMLHIW